MLLIILISIASSKSIVCCCSAICMFFSKFSFCSSSGEISMNIPKSCKYKSLISLSIDTLYLPICIENSSAKSEYSRISPILKEIHVASLFVIERPASSICLVAVLELKAAIFCIPTSASGLGVDPSLASFIPVTSRSIPR